jgi:hypothetical protein
MAGVIIATTNDIISDVGFVNYCPDESDVRYL